MKIRVFVTRTLVTLVICSVFALANEFQSYSQDSSLSNSVFLPLTLNGRELLAESEPNNTSDKANGPLSSDEIIKGYHNDFSDYFRFTVDAPGEIKVNFSSNYTEGINENKIQIQLYYRSASVENRVGEAKTPPFTITHNGNQGLYYLRVFTDECCLNDTKSYQLMVSFPQVTPTPTLTPLPTATAIRIATNTPTSTSTSEIPSATPTATSTPTPTTTPTVGGQSSSYLVTDFYIPTGWMLNGENPAKFVFDPGYLGNCHITSTCYKISWQPERVDWIGLYWLHPDADGTGGKWPQPGQPGCNFSGATTVTFWARGENGGEVIEFESAFYANQRVESGPITLTQEWKEYTMDIRNADLTNVVGAFAWYIFKTSNSSQIIFYLDDIRYQDVAADTVTCATPPTSTPSPIPITQWCDNFNDGQIDQSKWLSPTDANLIYEQDGVLNLRVTAEQSQGGEVWAKLNAIPAGQINAVSFATTLRSFTGAIPGAGGLGVDLEDTRIFSLDVGPGPDGPGSEFYLCHTLPCTAYDQSYHPGATSFPVNLLTPMRLVWTGETVKFFVNGEARVEAPTNYKSITGFHLYLYADPGSVFHATVDDVCVTYSDITAPTATPTASPKPTSQYGFNFESGTQKWTTSEGEYKYSILENTKQFVYSGNQALRLATELYSGSNEVSRHTETVAYFNNAIPEGFGLPGPYNLTGKTVSCFVYLPTALAPNGSSAAYIQLFVKDKDFRNQFNTVLDILPSNVNQWLQLSLTVGEGGGMDSGFDSSKINALGIRIVLHNQATLNYTGSFYIDHCTIPPP